ncbi:MAG: hypothetical protein WAO98_01720 [Alphaproteobacteria bacterium]
MATGEIHCLPPHEHKARPLAVFLLLVAPFLFGALSLYLGQDANWDLRNYHWYNAYAFLNGRYDLDLLPSQTPYFYNPTLDIPFYLIATHASAQLTGFLLGWVQGLNFILLFMLAHVSLIIPNPRQKVLVSAGLATLGMIGGGGIAMLGTVFYDNVTSLGIFLSALLVIRHFDRLVNAPLKKAFLLAFLFGIPSGLMMGLKLPSVIFCVGFCFALLFVGGTFQRRFMITFAFGLGVLCGVAVTLGHWAWFLQTHFGSPLFPYFNNVFHAPLAPDSSARDTQFITRSFHDFILFPFIFTDSPYRVGEIPWRDWRLLILYVLLPTAIVVRLFFGRSKNTHDAMAVPYAARYLLWAGALSYFTWLGMFCVYRYAIPMEMLAPLLIVFAVGMLPLKLHTRGLIAAFILVIIAASIQGGNWTRRADWSERFVETGVPELGTTSDVMVLLAGFEPYSHVIPQLPSDMRFVRIQSNFSSPDQNKGINQMLHDRVNAHKGRLMLLIPPWQKNVGAEALGYYDLALENKPCQTVIDHLYQHKPIDLCPVIRLKP